jgi:hypothetical protein
MHVADDRTQACSLRLPHLHDAGIRNGKITEKEIHSDSRSKDIFSSASPMVIDTLSNDGGARTLWR